MFCDNISTILLAANPILYTRTKLLEVDLYSVRDKVNKKQVLCNTIQYSIMFGLSSVPDFLYSPRIHSLISEADTLHSQKSMLFILVTLTNKNRNLCFKLNLISNSQFSFNNFRRR